jgi:hypothetical protein
MSPPIVGPRAGPMTMAIPAVLMTRFHHLGLDRLTGAEFARIQAELANPRNPYRRGHRPAASS